MFDADGADKGRQDQGDKDSGIEHRLAREFEAVGNPRQRHGNRKGQQRAENRHDE